MSRADGRLGTQLKRSDPSCAEARTARQPLPGTSHVLAGGASNWVDRLVRGSVVDLLNIGVGSLRTGIFNVADIAIMLGVAVLLLAQRRRSDDVRTTGDSSGQTA
jgi:lipoprotein signal peptidase